MGHNGGDATEVRLARQPRWAFAYSIGNLEAVAAHESDNDDDEDDVEETVVYIGEGRQLGDLPGAASRALGWK